MERTECAICSSAALKHLYTLEKFPYTFLPVTDSITDDTYVTLPIYSCGRCGCVQLKDLVDPTVLYEIPHNTTQETPMWKEHHVQFTEFVCAAADSRQILEIGGGSGVLSKRILSKKPHIKYTIMDLCDSNPPLENVEFIHGNCETSDISNQTTVILSHVFEHLYNPNTFIYNMKKNNITNIIISIPNMVAFIDKKTMPIIHQEHTYFCGKDDIEYMFSKMGYACKRTYSYKDHSLFFHFAYTAIAPYDIPSTIQRAADIYQIYEYNKTHISNIALTTPFYIVPAGLYGQLIYYFLKEEAKQHMIGFLDNDPSKIGKRLYGTPHSIFKMDRVANCPAITVIIFNAPYTAEIIQQLNSYNPDIRYIRV